MIVKYFALIAASFALASGPHAGKPFYKRAVDVVKQLTLNKDELDKKVPRPTKSELRNAFESSKAQVKELLLVRHAESESNAFGAASFTGKMAALGRNLISKESNLIDPPLSPEGVKQSMKLRKFVDENPGIFKEVPLIVSNLNRAVETAVNAFCHGEERFIVQSALQEITNNPGGVAYKIPTAQPQTLSKLVSDIKHENVSTYKNTSGETCTLDLEHNAGQKDPKSQAADRIRSFLDYIFSGNSVEKFAVIGHSKFFRTMVEALVPDEGYVFEKMDNASVVRLKVVRYRNPGGQVKYAIEPQSIERIFSPKREKVIV